MTSKAITGVGVQFLRWDDDSSVADWVELAEVKSISGPSPERETIDVTSLSSTGGYREFIAGIRDAGTVEMTLVFRRDTYEIIKSDFESDDLQEYRISIPDDEGTTFDFSGLVTGIPIQSIEVSSDITVNCTIKISGEAELSSGGVSV
jgi:predicted secreted protein